MSDSMRPTASDPSWDDILQAAADLQAQERTETTEPAIPVIAPIPVQAYRDLLQLAEVDLGGLSRTGVRVAFDITKAEGATVKAVATVMRVGGGTLDAGVKVTYFGREVSYGGFVQWTRQD